MNFLDWFWAALLTTMLITVGLAAGLVIFLLAVAKEVWDDWGGEGGRKDLEW